MSTRLNGEGRIALVMTLALVCALLSGIASATTYYVATTGNDTNSGTSAGSPFRTIQKGCDSVSAGDTVNVAAGHYHEHPTITKGGTPGSPVTIQGANGAIIDGSWDFTPDWTAVGGYNGVYKCTNLPGNTNCVTMDDQTLTDLWWGSGPGYGCQPLAWPFDQQLHQYHYARMFTYSFANVSGLPDCTMWGGHPEGWDACRGLALYIPGTGLWVKCQPGNSANPIDITSGHTMAIAPADVPVVKIDGANDIILKNFTIKNGYWGINVYNSRGGVIEDCVISPTYNGIKLYEGTDGYIIRFNEISMNPYSDRSTQSRTQNVWAMSKMHLQYRSPYAADKVAIYPISGLNNHRIHDNYIHDAGVGIGTGWNRTAEEESLSNNNVEIDHNYLVDLYQDGIAPMANGTNMKIHHNVNDNVLQAMRLFGIMLGPCYVYNNIWVDGPKTSGSIVHFSSSDGYSPHIYVYNNTVCDPSDYNNNDGVVASACYTHNMFDSGGGIGADNYHYYNNLFYSDRFFRMLNSGTDADWDGNYNVYVRRTEWKTDYGQSYATSKSIDLNSLWTTSSPGFTDYANSDVSLTSGSPARGAGHDLNTHFGFTLPGSPSTDCGALAYGVSMPDLPRTEDGTPAAPSLWSISPSTGLTGGGTSVTLGGSYLAGASVSFGGSAGTSVGVGPGGTDIICTAPAHSSGSVNVTVITSYGTSNALGFTYSGTSTTTLNTTADSMVASGAPTTNYGSGNNNQTQWKDTGVWPILKFDLSSVQGSPVTSAILRVYKITSTSNHSINIYSVSNDSWLESTVTWNNKPTRGTSQATVQAGATGWYQWDIATFVGNELAGNKLVTVYMIDEGNTGIWTQWSSKEGSNPPKLIVTTGGEGGSTPTLTAISPTSGTTAGGTSCTLTGTNFISGATVSFGGVAATNVTVVSGTQITCTSPEKSAGAAAVTVTTSGGTSGSVTYTYVTPTPTLSSISPASGTTSGGTACTLTGTYLTGCTSVSFGGTAATNVVVVSDTSVTCNSPAKVAGTISVTATTGSGTSNGVNYVFVASTPTLSAISPGSGGTGGGTACTLTGTNLIGTTGVSFGGTAATGIVVDSSTQVRCTSPAKSAGTYSVTATTAGGTSNGVNFIYTASAPTLSSLSPSSGPAAGGTAVTLTGTNLTGCSAVSFGGTAATGIVVDSSTQVRCTNPAKSAGTYSVTATTPGGTSNGVNFIYVAAPTLSSLSPTSGTTAGGTAVTLTGTALTGCSAVSFGGTAATGIVVDSSTQVRCTSPAKSAGTYSVTATTPGGTSNGVNYIYTGGGSSYTNTLYTTADSLVASGAANTNYGNNNNMQTLMQYGNNWDWGIMKFSLSSVSGSTVTSARLRVYRYSTTTTSHTINAFSSSVDGWLESTVTWNNKPTKGSSQATVVVSGKAWYEWTITSFVNSEFAGDKTVTLYLTDENNANVWSQWSSKEYSGTTYDPRLIVISQ